MVGKVECVAATTGLVLWHRTGCSGDVASRVAAVHGICRHLKRCSDPAVRLIMGFPSSGLGSFL